MKTTRASLDEIYAPIHADLDAFSALLKKELSSEDKLLRGIHEHLLKMSGKFLRPALVLLSARLGERGANDKAVRLAVAIELIHTATLVHDDIIDGSELRRNQPSLPARWGRDISIVAGDYLYAKAFVLLADLEDVWVNRGFARCAHVMCEGEMKQIEKRNDFLITDEEYFAVIRKKTAALFQMACMGGGYFSGVGLGRVEELGRYGLNLGMAFQIVDDCLDLTGKAEDLGKSAGLDLSRSDMTLPLLFLFRGMAGAEREPLLRGLQDPQDGLFDRIRTLAVERGAVESAMGRARRFAEDGRKALSGFPASPSRDSLAALVDFCLDRVS